MRDVETLIERKERPLVAAVGDAHHERVEDARRTSNEIFVTARQRIERTRVHGDYHGLLLSSVRLKGAAPVRGPATRQHRTGAISGCNA
jgi:hypothetical protein